MNYFEISLASFPILSSIVFTSSEKVGDADLSTSFMEVSLSLATKRQTSSLVIEKVYGRQLKLKLNWRRAKNCALTFNLAMLAYSCSAHIWQYISGICCAYLSLSDSHKTQPPE